MSSDVSFDDISVCIPVISFDTEIGERFIEGLGLNPGKPSDLQVGNRIARVELVKVADELSGDVEAVLGRADAVLLLVRFMDQITMSRVRDIHQLIHQETFLPRSYILVRDADEAQFKISCGYCGQKLWVRDHDVGRRGNCPRCRKTFIIPAQKTLLISSLMLTDMEPVDTVTIGDEDGNDVFAALIDRIENMGDSMKSSTMKIELPPPEDSGSDI